jgi:hypothetical protein
MRQGVSTGDTPASDLGHLGMMLTRVLLISAENQDFYVRTHVAKAAEHAAQDRLISNIEPAV